MGPYFLKWFLPPVCWVVLHVCRNIDLFGSKDGLVAKSGLQPHGLQSTSLLCPWDFPGKITRVGCFFPSPGDLPSPGINPASPAVQAASLPLSHQESPRGEKARGSLLRANTKPGAYCSDGLILAGSQVHFKAVSPVCPRTSHL